MAVNKNENNGVVYICGTPIGNLEDITFRAIRVLKEVNAIYAEDTRRALKLLNYYSIKTPVFHYDEHNHLKIKNIIFQKISAGESIALISEAGMPCVSDPGSRLVEECHENQIKVVPIPGPSSLCTSFSVSGVKDLPLVFLGFISNKNKTQRYEIIKTYGKLSANLLFFESPRKIKRTLNEINEVLGNRKVLVARELTKLFEEIYVTDLPLLIKRYDEEEVRGEFTIIIFAGEKELNDNDQADIIKNIKEEIHSEIKTGELKKEIARRLANKYSINKKVVYKLLIENE